MKIHHLNCGTCCPIGGRLFDGSSDALHAHLVCHCLLIESDAGLVLVDTGFGTRDIANDHRLSGFVRNVVKPVLRPAETALAQVKALGFSHLDVRHILVTHLDSDHAGGLEDFPNAIVHVTSREKEAADQRKGGLLVGKGRYRPEQWNEVKSWRLYPFGGGDRWFGFDAVRDLDGLPPEILLVPLPGHTWGHSGVAIREAGGKWLLHAGDSYFYRGEVGGEHYSCPPGMRFYQRLMEVDRKARLANLGRLRRLAVEQAAKVRLFSAHDAMEFDLLAGGKG